MFQYCAFVNSFIFVCHLKSNHTSMSYEVEKQTSTGFGLAINKPVIVLANEANGDLVILILCLIKLYFKF